MIELKVNGRSHAVDADPDTPLLYVLRENLQLNAAKYGCGLGQCGSCTVMANGEAIFSCIMPIHGPMQRAFIEEQALQCGYCIPGMMMRAQALLQKNSAASDAEIRKHLEPHLCRCGTHMRILRAVRRAAVAMRKEAAAPSTGKRS